MEFFLLGLVGFILMVVALSASVYFGVKVLGLALRRSRRERQRRYGRGQEWL